MQRQERRKRKANGANGRRRTNNTGTLERRGDKWLARWYVRTEQGKRIRKSQTIDASGIDEARLRLQELTEGNALITREKMLERTQKELIGISAERKAWEDGLPTLPISHAWIAYKRSSARPDTGERTLADYEGYFSALESWMATHYPDLRELRHITQGEATAFADDLRARRSAGTYNKRIVFFRHFWKVLSDDAGKDPQAKDPAALPAKLTCNPWEKIQKREVVSHSRRELTVEELARVCSLLEGEMRLLFAVGIYTGLRLGDAALLEWGCVDLVRRRIMVIPRKTARHAHGKQTLIPIHETLAAMLAEIPQNKRKGYVLPETAADYIREPSILTNRIQRHFRDCGIKTQVEQGEGRKALTDVGYHSLRHTFVSLSANAGAPLAIVQAIVGHSNPAMTRHYFHEQESALRGAVASLPDVIDVDRGAETASDAPERPAEREDVAEGATMPQNAETRLQAFKAAFGALSASERKAALDWIAKTPLAPMNHK